MKLVLFIGHHKVGTTSLQDFLSRNAVPLARSGILYPSVEFEGMAMMLASAITGQDPVDVLPINAREPHNALAFRMLADHQKGKVPPFHKGLPGLGQMFRAINKQIEFLDPHTVILVAEVFANFAPADPALIERLKDAFPGADITLIATLRRIDEYLASWHGQRLTFGHKPEPLRTSGMMGYFNNIHFDYRLMLEGWIDAMPEAQMILRDYADVRAAGGSVTDFAVQAGLELPQGLLGEQRSNQSLHRGVYEIARQGNKALRPGQATRLRQILRDMTPDLDLPASGDIELFGAENRADLLDRFEPIHRFLAQISGKPTFFADQQEARQIRPVPEMEAYQEALSGVTQRAGDIEEPDIRDFVTTLAAEVGAGVGIGADA
ncbi:MAG TPA: hypothetical protein EYP31_07770 [Roseibacterium sp.]|nr:hypothetical protein [Roseibacterium sp.]